MMHAWEDAITNTVVHPPYSVVCTEWTWFPPTIPSLATFPPGLSLDSPSCSFFFPYLDLLFFTFSPLFSNFHLFYLLAIIGNRPLLASSSRPRETSKKPSTGPATPRQQLLSNQT